jgi:hypothetical protein
LFLPIVIAVVAGKYIHSILFYSILIWKTTPVLFKIRGCINNLFFALFIFYFNSKFGFIYP